MSTFELKDENDIELAIFGQQVFTFVSTKDDHCEKIGMSGHFVILLCN